MALDYTKYNGRGTNKSTGAARDVTYLTDSNEWVDKVYQLENSSTSATADKVLGGNLGIANAQAQALANRTAYLKALGDSNKAEITALKEVATTSKAGLMSAADKTKLNGIVAATTTKDGLMSAADKVKLNGLPTFKAAFPTNDFNTITADGIYYSANITPINHRPAFNGSTTDVRHGYLLVFGDEQILLTTIPNTGTSAGYSSVGLHIRNVKYNQWYVLFASDSFFGDELPNQAHHIQDAIEVS